MVHSKLWIVAAFAAVVSQLPAQDKSPVSGSPVPVAQPVGSQAVGSQPVGAQPVDAAARAKNAPMIGVVDLDKAIELYPKAIAERERLQNLSKQLSERINGLTKQIDQIKAEMTVLKEGSDDREDKEYELAQALKNREGTANFLKSKFDRQLEKFELMIYQDLEAAVAQVAKASGVQIVLRVRPSPGFEDAAKEGSNAQKQKLASFDRRQVWFASDEVDLTPALIKLLRLPVEAKSGADAPKDAAGKSAAGASGKKDGGL